MIWEALLVMFSCTSINIVNSKRVETLL